MTPAPDPAELEKFWNDVLEAEGLPEELDPMPADWESVEALAEQEAAQLEVVEWLPED